MIVNQNPIVPKISESDQPSRLSATNNRLSEQPLLRGSNKDMDFPKEQPLNPQVKNPNEISQDLQQLGDDIFNKYNELLQSYP